MKILIADDHPLIRDSLSQAVRELDGDAETFQASTAAEVQALLEANPDTELLLLDLIMPGSDGFNLLESVCRDFPEVKVVVLSASEDPGHMRKSLDAGASGFVPKSSRRSITLSALRLVIDGGVYVPPELLSPQATAPTPTLPTDIQPSFAGITPRQQTVLRLLTDGKSNKEIARSLNLSEHTVKIHVASILRSLGVSNRTQAAMIARRKGLANDG